jgi:surface antigen
MKKTLSTLALTFSLSLSFSCALQTQTPELGIKSETNKEALSFSTKASFVPSYVSTAFYNKERSVGSGLGYATSNIITTPDGRGYERSYAGANGAGAGKIYYKNGSLFWIHGSIYSKFLSLGGITRLGYPTTDELDGLKSSVSGKTSRYQMFDAYGNPSLQYHSGQTYLLLSGIRGYWLNNQKLGLPTSDELSNPVRQNFEGGVVYWNNGNPYIQTSNNNTSSSYPAPNFSLSVYGSKNPIILRNGWSYKGQCTWYVAGRLLELGLSPKVLGSDGFKGHANDWANYGKRNGLTVSKTPKKGAVYVSTNNTFGHVAFVERVNSDGSFVITESNLKDDSRYNGERRISGVSSNVSFVYTN